MYAGPPGSGRLVYDPEVGITRSDATTNQNEQALYAAAQSAFDEKRWDDCIAATTSLSQTYPEGSRVVDAIMLRIRANFEAGRAAAVDGFGKSQPLDRWMFLYLSPDHDTRLRQLAATGSEAREIIAGIRAMTVQEFVAKLRGDAVYIYASGRLAEAQRDVETLSNYYLPVAQLTEYRRDMAELGRNVCWLMYAAGDNNRAIFTAEDLLAINPPPSVKADTLFVMGLAQARNGAAPISANTFGLLYRGAGLRDTDTRWRPYALMWQINQTMETSKGFIYDLVYYERALELLGEYELYRFENPNIPAALHNEFVLLFRDVYNIMADRHRNAADTYSRLGEDQAAAHYLVRADEAEAELARRLKALNES